MACVMRCEKCGVQDDGEDSIEWVLATGDIADFAPDEPSFEVDGDQTFDYFVCRECAEELEEGNDE